jgi:hypothetical protein
LSIGGSGAVLSDVGTIGTILSPVAVVDRGTIIATISGTIVTERVSSGVVLERNASLTGGFVGTFDMSSWDSQFGHYCRNFVSQSKRISPSIDHEY